MLCAAWASHSCIMYTPQAADSGADLTRGELWELECAARALLGVCHVARGALLQREAAQLAAWRNMRPAASDAEAHSWGTTASKHACMHTSACGTRRLQHWTLCPEALQCRPRIRGVVMPSR